MSDATTPRLKVSREGVVLIKSFEGFRPRAERLADGRWVVGHGHTLSAREGATVDATEAELLLHYDLLDGHLEPTDDTRTKNGSGQVDRQPRHPAAHDLGH